MKRSESLDRSLIMRITASQKKLFERTAEREGLTLSAWIRSTCLREARRTPASPSPKETGAR